MRYNGVRYSYIMTAAWDAKVYFDDANGKNFDQTNVTVWRGTDLQTVIHQIIDRELPRWRRWGIQF